MGRKPAARHDALISEKCLKKVAAPAGTGAAYSDAARVGGEEGGARQSFVAFWLTRDLGRNPYSTLKRINLHKYLERGEGGLPPYLESRESPWTPFSDRPLCSVPPALTKMYEVIDF